MKSLIKRIVLQMIHDKRSLALILVVPLLMMTLMYFLLGQNKYIPKVAVRSLPPQIVMSLKEENIKLIELTNIDKTDNILKDKTADAVISMNISGIQIKMLEMDSVKTAKVVDALTNAIAKLNPGSEMKISYVYGSSSASTFDSLGYMFLGFLSFFFVFLISGISFVRERTSGTLERLMLTPIKRSSVALGYTAGFGIFAAIQSVLLVLFTKYLLKTEFTGSIWVAILVMLLLAFVAVSLGEFVSIYASNEFQVMQFIPIVIIPQIFFSGIIQVDTLPYRLSYLKYIMPIYYGSAGLKGIMINGQGFFEIWEYILMLFIFIIVLFIVNTLALKKYRTL